jgi:DNA or RNA helicases of superfamily II
MVQLRDYQHKAEHDIREAYRRGYRAPVLVMPTRSGKTVLFVDIARRASERGTKVLVLVHRQELLAQTSRAMDAFGVEHGLIARGISHSLGLMNVQVASVQTLVRRIGRFSWRPDLIVVDEAHHAIAGNTWGTILHHFSGARILGCTATPERYDGHGLGVGSGGFFDCMVAGAFGGRSYLRRVSLEAGGVRAIRAGGSVSRSHPGRGIMSRASWTP